MFPDIFAYYKGLLFGFVLATSFGPVFLAMLETGMKHGFPSAATLAAGTLGSDAFFISIAFMGITAILTNVAIHFWIGIIGGFVLIVYGATMFNKQQQVFHPIEQSTQITRSLSIRDYSNFFAKGFVVNSLNPSILIFWMGVMSVISVGTSFTTGEKIAFFAGILTTDFIANLIKAFLSGKVVKYVKPHYLQYVNRVAGVSMVIFGLRLLYQTFFV